MVNGNESVVVPEVLAESRPNNWVSNYRSLMDKFRKGTLSALASGLFISTVLAPSLAMLSTNSARADDNIEILAYGDSSKGVVGSSPYIVRTVNGVDLSGDDNLWMNNMPPPFVPQFLKLYTDPYGTELYGDVRSYNSTLFNGKIMAVNQDDPQGFLPALTSKVEFNIRDSSPTNNYIARFSLPSQYAQDNIGFTNIIKATQGATSPDLNFKSMQNGTIGAFVDVSATPKTQSFSMNEDAAPVVLGLSGGIVPGVIFQLATSPTNGNAVISGNNLTYTPNTNYNGLDFLKYNILSVNGTTTNNLGDVSYNITVNSVNDAPTDVSLSKNDINENSAVNTQVGILSSTEVDSGNTHTYTLVGGDTSAFNISGNQLRLNLIPNYEVKNNYNVTVRSTDNLGASLDKSFAININDINEAPASIGLSNNNINENSSIGSIIGNFNTVDPDISDNFTYNVVGGDISAFTISGNQLKLNVVPDYETKNSYSVDIKSADAGGLAVTNTFNVNIINLNEPPILSDSTSTTNRNKTITGALQISDPENNVVSASIVQAPLDANLTFNGLNYSLVPNAGFTGTNTALVKVTDSGGLDSATKTLTFVHTNTVPTINAQTVNLSEDAINVPITVVGADSDGDTVVYNLVSNPTNGTLSGTLPNLLYTPNPNYFGSDSFKVSASDGLASATNTISLNIAGVNDNPVITAPTFTSTTTNRNSAVSGTLTATDVDNTQGQLSIQLQNPGTVSTNGIFTTSGLGYTFTPTNNLINMPNPLNLEMKVIDSSGGISSTTTTNQIVYTNTPPTVPSQNLTGTEDTPKVINLNPTDGDGDNLAVDASTSLGTLTGTGLTRTLTPPANYNGPITVTYTADDGIDRRTNTVNVVFDPVNDNPVITAPTFTSTTTNRNSAVSGTLTASDVDNAQNQLSVQAVNLDTNLLFSSNGLTYTVTPTNGVTGLKNLELKVTDGTGFSQTVTNYLNYTNTVPTANSAIFNLSEESNVSGTASGSDADADQLAITRLTNPTKGNVTGTFPNFTYTANPDQTGTDSFQFKVDDGLASATNTVTFNIAPVNDNPVITSAPETITTNRNSAITRTIAATDVDNTQGQLSIQLQNPGTVSTNGIFTTSGLGYTFTPTNNLINMPNPLNLEMKVIDSSGGISSTTTTNQIVYTNTPPTVPSQNLTGTEDTPKVINLNPTDGDGDQLIIDASTSLGSLSGSGLSRTLTPPANYTGPITVTYTADDGIARRTNTVNVAFDPVNDNPVITSSPTITTTNRGKIITGSVSVEDVDNAQSDLSIEVVKYPTNLLFGATNLNWSVNPTNRFVGTDSLEFKVRDSNGGVSQTQTNVFTYTNSIPQAIGPDNVNVAENGSVPITLQGSDLDLDPINFTIVSGPAHGVISGTAPNLTYAPFTNYSGSDSISFKVNDGLADSNVKSVSIGVNNLPNNPIGSDFMFSTLEDTVKTFNFPSFIDYDGDTNLTAVITQQPSKGNLSGNVFTPNNNANGSDLFKYKVVDSTGLESPIYTASINIDSVNDAPTGVSLPNLLTLEDTVLNFGFPVSDVDTPSNLLNVNVVNGPTNGILNIINGTNGVYTPGTNFFGNDYFTFKVNDGSSNSPTYSASITVNPANDAPVVANPIPNLTNTYGNTFSYTFPANTFNDVDSGDNLTFTANGLPPGINLDSNTKTLSGTNFAAGNFLVDLIASDSGNLKATNTIPFNVGKKTATIGTLATNSVYGDNVVQIPIFKSGFVNGDDAGVNVAGSTTATNMAPVGEYDTTINLTGQNLESILSNYNVSNNLAKYNVLQRDVSLFANGFTNQYGNVPPAVSWRISNLAGADTIASFSGSPVISHGVTPFTLAGTNAITINPGSLTNANYSITNSVGANAVTTTAPLTFNILGTNVIYKGAIPDLSVTTTGAKNGDVVVGIAGTTATNGSPAGSYPTFLNAINGPSQFDLRYGPIITNANPVNVVARGLELRFVNASVPYGDVINLGTNWQVNGLQAGDSTTGSPNVTSPAVQGVNVGSYPGDIALGGLSAGPNYAFTNVVPGQVNIVPRNASFNIEGFTRGYGDTNPPVNVIASNLYAPDGILASAISQVGTNDNVGVYTNAFNLDLSPINKLGNYNFDSTNMNNITITNVPLVLSADDKNRLYGETNSILTGGISGLKNNDNIVPVFSTTALQNSSVGEFPITVNISDPDNRAGNYNILTNNGKLTVGKAPLNVSSDDKNMFYGGSVPALTGNAFDLKNGGDGISLGYSTLASPLVNAGDYPVEISINDPSNRLSNYLVSTNKGNVHVGKAPLLVKGKDASRLYGEENPPLEAIVTGGVNGNTFVTDATTTATLTSGIGEFPVKPSISGSNTNNYNITLEDGKMIVNKAPLPVTVGSGSHIYGNFPQTISASASGVRNGDVIVVNPVNPATQISNVGTYTTSAILSGDKITNYAPTITVGSYNVIPTDLNVRAEDKLRRSNENNPALTFNATGYKLGQGNEVFTVPPSLFTGATNGSAAGDYAINISGGNAPNYNLNYVNGNMKVLPNITPPAITGIGVSNGLVNLVGNAFIDNPNGMKLTSLYSDNLNTTNWLPTGVTNILYPNVVNGTNQAQDFGINLTNQNSAGRFFKLMSEDKK